MYPFAGLLGVLQEGEKCAYIVKHQPSQKVAVRMKIAWKGSL